MLLLIAVPLCGSTLGAKMAFSNCKLTVLCCHISNPKKEEHFLPSSTEGVRHPSPTYSSMAV